MSECDRRTVRALTALALAVVLGVTLSACTETAEPKPLASPAATASSTAPTSPAPPAPPSTPTPPTMPPEARGTSAASAKAFVRFYVEMINFATSSGDIEALRALDDGSCRSCAAVAKRINDVYDSGGEDRECGLEGIFAKGR